MDTKPELPIPNGFDSKSNQSELRRHRVLICDDDPLYHLGIRSLLTDAGYASVSAYATEDLIGVLKRETVQLVLLDIQFNDSNEGLPWITRLREFDPELAVIVVSGRSDYRTVRDALMRGATDYITKDGDPDEILRVIHRSFERLCLLKRQSQHDFENRIQQRQHLLIGGSLELQKLRRTIEKVSRGSGNVTIFGETGTGKELVARNLRQQRPDGSYCPFISVDSSTIQSSMAESLLFGHEKGAFTGALRTTKGIFEEANGGIVYFDEIANMPLEIQAKLLRVLQEKEICRLGSSRVVHLDFRVVCATNQDLKELSAQGKFKPDLYQRLNVIPITVPPLRDRPDDILPLIHHFSSKQNRMPPPKFSAMAVSALLRYSWPGNVRELSNLMIYLATLIEHSPIELEDLPALFHLESQEAPPKAEITQNFDAEPSNLPVPSFYEQISQFEKSTLAREYRHYQGNIRRMATELRMDRSHLHTKLRTFGIHPSSRAHNTKSVTQELN